MLRGIVIILALMCELMAKGLYFLSDIFMQLAIAFLTLVSTKKKEQSEV